MPAAVDTHLASVLDGNIDAYEHVIREHECDVWPIASVMLYDRATTERFVCEIFARAYLQIRQYDPRYPFRGFVMTIARQAVRERLALAARGSGRLSVFRDHLTKVFADDQMAVLYQHKLQETLDGCLQQVEEKGQAALQLRYEQGLGAAEISRQVGRPIASVRQALNRTRVALTRCIMRKAAADGGQAA